MTRMAKRAIIEWKHRQGKEVCCLIAFAALIDDQQDLLKFNDLVERYQGEMLRIARSILHDHQLAEDAVQNALYGVAVSFSHVPADDPDAAHAYLLSCAKYAALRLDREEHKLETTEVLDISELSRGEDPTFEEILRSDDYERLLRAIGQLDELYQDVLLHRYVYDQSVKEIAKLFGRKPSAIRQQLLRGKRLLVEICRKEGILCG